jgi:MFS family permease
VPQIRFSAREPSSDAVVTRAVVFASGASSASISSSVVFPPSCVQVEAAPNTRRSGGFDRQAAVRSALNAGAIAAVMSLLPFGFILAMPLAGFLGVRLYRRRGLPQELSTGAGFKLGALCGAFGCAIFTVLAAILTLASHAQNEFQDKMIEAVRHAQAGYPDTQARQLDYFITPQGLVVMMVLTFVSFCVAFVLLSGVGAAISAALLRRRGPPA